MLCTVFDGSPSIPEAECRSLAERKWNDGKSCDWRGAFFLRKKMSSILISAKAYEKLLDIEYQFILGRKNKQISFSVFFNEYQFFHLSGLQYLVDRSTLLYGDRKKLFYLILNEQIKESQISSSEFYPEIKDRVESLESLESIFNSNKTVFKYNPQTQAFSMIESEFLMKNEVNSRNVFTFLSKDKSSGKYFCRSFFPQTDRDYSIGQTNWALLYKKKIHKSTGKDFVLCDRLNKKR